MTPWRKYATSAECKIDISTVVTVKNGLDFFVIRCFGSCLAGSLGKGIVGPLFNVLASHANLFMLV